MNSHDKKQEDIEMLSEAEYQALESGPVNLVDKSIFDKIHAEFKQAISIAETKEPEKKSGGLFAKLTSMTTRSSVAKLDEIITKIKFQYIENDLRKQVIAALKPVLDKTQIKKYDKESIDLLEQKTLELITDISNLSAAIKSNINPALQKPLVDKLSQLNIYVNEEILHKVKAMRGDHISISPKLSGRPDTG